MTDIIDRDSSEAHFGYSISLLFGMLTPSLNPILYTLFNEKVKEHLQEKCGFFRCIRGEAAAEEGLELETIEKDKGSNDGTVNHENAEGKLLLPTEEASSRNGDGGSSSSQLA